jgi:2-(1,2-epoxy-1,2-dihydrophenyl)acetyl-CoA isomerase
VIEGLVGELYQALAAGDAARVEELLAPDFDGHFAHLMPLGIGGHKVGAVAAREQGWWAIGRAFSVRIEPEEWIGCADGRLLVIGRYIGRARSTGRQFEAAFAHLWAARDGRLESVHQFTDTASWAAALTPPA